MRVTFNKDQLLEIIGELLKLKNTEEDLDLLIDYQAHVKKANLKCILDLGNCPEVLVKYLSRPSIGEILTKAQHREILKFTNRGPVEESLDKPLPNTLRNLYSTLEIVNRDSEAMFVKVCERYYPVTMQLRYESGYGYAHIGVEINLRFGSGKTVKVFQENFYAEGLKMSSIEDGTMTLRDFLKTFNIYFLEDFDSEDFDLATAKAQQYFPRGNTMECSGLGLVWHTEGYQSRVIETPLNGYTIITEPELEWRSNADKNDKSSPVPLIRGFCFELKKYVLIDARDLTPKQWDKTLINRLVLPDDIKYLVTKLFMVNQTELLKDIIKSKSQNLIIMASGNPGIGKTLTGEVYSHLQSRPLYILEVAEVGSKLEKIEENLKQVFERISTWDCILLFDEADIFFQHRDTNLERSVIVGIFLRMLEQFRGILFLTTNRPEVIDRAFYSRVTVHLKYPDLTIQAKRFIWEDKLAHAEINLQDPENLDLLASHTLNGREIHNKVKILKIIYDGKPVTVQQLDQTLKMTL